MKPNLPFDPLWYYRSLERADDVSGLRHFVTGGNRYSNGRQAERPAHDTPMFEIVAQNWVDRHTISSGRMGRFNIGWPSNDDGINSFADLSGTWSAWVHLRKPQITTVLEIDVTPAGPQRPGATHTADISALSAAICCSCSIAF